MRKTLFIFVTILIFLFGMNVMADDALSMNTVEILIDITESPANVPFKGSAELELNGAVYKKEFTASETDTLIHLKFDVPQFKSGTKFDFKVTSGFDKIKYYDSLYDANSPVELQTYTHLVNDVPVSVSTFHLHGITEVSHPVEFYFDFKPINIYPVPRYYDGVLYVPAAAGAKAMGVSHIGYDAENGKLNYWIMDKEMTLNVGSREVNAFGKTYILEREVITFDEIPFIPLISFAEIIEADVLIQDEPDHINAIVWYSKVVEREVKNFARNQYINQANISSQTEYMIWVNKSDYTLRVYNGTENNWNLIRDITCAIGKDSTPTCTGIFTYYSKEKIWPYSSYYVGPIMRFNGGYAIHTTLLRYDGSPYDNRVGMKLSHGCVRLQPQDMQWLIDLIPLGTTVYITNE